MPRDRVQRNYDPLKSLLIEQRSYSSLAESNQEILNPDQYIKSIETFIKILKDTTQAADINILTGDLVPLYS